MAAAGAVVLAFSSAAPAGAASAIDQSLPAAGSPQTNLYQQLAQMAQSFTAGQTGQLDRLTLFTGAGGFLAPSFTVQVWTVDATRPTLANAGATPRSYAFTGFTGTNTWHNFDLSPAVAVSAGTQYAVVVSTRANTLRWGFINNYSYSGGNLWLCCDATGKWIATRTSDFGLKTWVTVGAPTNTSPTVAADSSSVTFNEGTTQTNTGTYSDPDGDTVALSASTGTLTRTGTGTGTWSWSHAGTDEGAAQTVTITADDGHNPALAATFTVNVIAVAPKATILTDPTQIPEGKSEPFSGGATSSSVADNAAGFTYGWTVTKNGRPYASGSGANFSFTPDDEGTFVVTFTATDDGQQTGSDSMTMYGQNIAPTATINSVTASAPLVITPQQLLTFRGSFTDPGTLDTHTANWDFGDGTSAAGFTSTHSFDRPGTYRVVLTVTDDDGGVGTSTTYVTVLSTQQALTKIAGFVNGLSSLNKGQKNSLVAKLNAASASASRGDTNATSNQLNAFLNEVRADQNTGKLSAGDAATLRNAVYAVKGAIGTYNRFLEWWPLGL